ncbi:DUF2000 domain-containing protein [Streptomyces triticirhizae]|uniref:DUF2000 domain-containing protein n=1 Tax=Streptomyces triticirhizae TaxID=2483353 RepID=A0A3M2LG73_9ACTN|nr:DUF2000 domain-containing protein [Streptomyces triticirhizae]RMI36434.1 DUF2000 domain-containing protein [Streptomyces triticirhizae]
MSHDIKNSKCVIVVNGELPLGLTVNAASVVSLTLGRGVPELIGEDVKDAEGGVHLGITLIPVPILRSTAERIAEIHQLATADPEVTVVGFSDLAQSCRTYEEYIERMTGTQPAELTYSSVGLFGPRKQLNKWTGSLALLR